MSLPPIRSLKPSPHDDFLKSVAVLCAFLDIPEVVMPPVRYYIERVGLDLNLPGEIRELAACIAHRLGLQPFWKSKNVQFPYHDISPLPFIELKACAVLLFTLKLRFGIDGLTEQIDSDDARQRNANLKEGDQRFFVVMDWVNQLKRRRHFLLRRGEFCILRGVQFENFYSTACMERDESKRRGDFYRSFSVNKDCARLLAELDANLHFRKPNLVPTSWPMRGTLFQLVGEEDPQDVLGLLQDMTKDSVIPKEKVWTLLATGQGRFSSRLDKKLWDCFGSSSHLSYDFMEVASAFASYCLTEASLILPHFLSIQKEFCKAFEEVSITDG